MVLENPLDRLQQVRSQREVVVQHLLRVDEQRVRVGRLQQAGQQGDGLRVASAVTRRGQVSGFRSLVQEEDLPVRRVTVKVLVQVDEAAGDQHRVTFGLVEAAQQARVEVPHLLDVAEQDLEFVHPEAGALLPILKVAGQGEGKLVSICCTIFFFIESVQNMSSAKNKR